MGQGLAGIKELFTQGDLRGTEGSCPKISSPALLWISEVFLITLSFPTASPGSNNTLGWQQLTLGNFQAL